MYDKNTTDDVSNMPADENNILVGLSKDLSNIIPTRKDYVFASWTTKDVEVVNGKFTMPGKNVTFKANWKDDKNNNGIDDSTEIKYSITYTTDYSDVTGMPSSVEGLLSGIEHSITSAVPTKLGYTFIGWTTEDVEVVNGKFTMPEKNITFKANFEANKDTIYKVITKVERLNGTYTNDVEVIKGITDQVITLNPTNKDGFTVSNNSVLTGTVTANKILELTIIYTRNTYKVNYVSNGNIIDTKLYKYEQEVNYRPANPTRVNYTFNGLIFC